MVANLSSSKPTTPMWSSELSLYCHPYSSLVSRALWIAFGQGASTRWIPVHEVVSAIGPQKASGLLYFHAFTGCDVVSAFHGKGKKSVWLTWDVCDEVSETFTKLSHCPTEVSDDDLQKLEKFVVHMHDRSSAATGVDEARLDLCTQAEIL